MNRTRRLIQRATDERGALSAEFALGAPILIAVVLLLVVAGRIALAENEVQTAASAAARAASIALTTSDAETSASQVAYDTLSESGYLCSTLTVDIDDEGIASPLGVSASVSVTVTCVISMSDIALPGLAGTRTFTETASSPVDSFRERN